MHFNLYENCFDYPKKNSYNVSSFHVHASFFNSELTFWFSQEITVIIAHYCLKDFIRKILVTKSMIAP